MFAYCYNNPISYVDPRGTSPKFWAQLASGLMIVGGAICMFIPGAQVAGLALIGGGIGSLVGGEISETVGGDYLTGWLIGGVIGTIGGGYIGSLPAVTSFMSSTFTLGGSGSILAGVGITSGTMLLTTGAQIIGAVSLATGITIMFAKDPFIKYLERGMTQNQKEQFQRGIEGHKGSSGRGGSDNLLKEWLREFAEWIKQTFK